MSCVLRHWGTQLILAYTVGQGLLSLLQERVEGEHPKMLSAVFKWDGLNINS